MTLSHAVLWIDHHNAQLLSFDADQVQAQQIRAHEHQTRQHGSSVRTGHEFFGEVCNKLEGIDSVLVTGGHQAQADFRHYLNKHRAAVVPSVVGWETVDKPTDGQLLALARRFFVKADGMAGSHNAG